MKFDFLDKQYAQLSNTIRRRTWNKIKTNGKTVLIHRYLEDILRDFKNEADEELNGMYRNHKVQLSYEQEEQKNQLMRHDYSCLLTINLPSRKCGKFTRTRNQNLAQELYKSLIKELECLFTDKPNHFKRNMLQFEGVLEHGDKGFWHVHLLIKKTENDEIVITKLCYSIVQLVNKYGFPKTTIDLRSIYDKEGVCSYMVKELFQTDDKVFDEGSFLFNSKIWYHSTDTNFRFFYYDLKILPYIIRFGLWLKQVGYFVISNPINKLIKTLKKTQIKLGWVRKKEE